MDLFNLEFFFWMHEFIIPLHTSVMQRLFPEDACEVLGPGLLHLPAGGLEGVGVLALPPSEPDLETQAAAATVMGHAQV